jgi:hypothetical protein
MVWSCKTGHFPILHDAALAASMPSRISAILTAAGNESAWEARFRYDPGCGATNLKSICGMKPAVKTGVL